MKDRITSRHLDAACEEINRLTGSPLTPYTTQEGGRMRANIGNYHISGAYGGVSLHRMMNEGGGIVDVFRSGHMPKRELFDRMKAYAAGIRDEQERGQQ